MRQINYIKSYLLILILMITVAACGSAGNGKVGNETSEDNYTVGGTLSGLGTGKTVVLQNNGTDDLSRTSNGSFTFTTKIANAASYDVTVKTQPSGQICTVTNGSGTVSGADVTNVAVNCTGGSTPTTYSIGGTVSGLSGTGLVLQNNGTNDLSISTNGAFTFTTKFANGSAYVVTVKTQPSNPTQTCTVNNGIGTVSGADVTNVAVNCTGGSSPTTYSIGGTVSGLTGSGLVLQNNGADDLPISASGAFTFTTKVLSGAAYAVTVKTQPSNPSQTCTVSNGSGTVSGVDVTNVAVNCTGGSTPTYSIGGTLSGLGSGKTIVLQNNGTDDLSRTSNGSFTFTTKIANAASYDVTVKTQPSGQICTVTNGSGTVSGADVTNVTVNCIGSSPPAGSLDTTFGTNGKVTTAIGTGDDYAYALGIQSDGKIVAAGYTAPASGGTYDFALVRYNTDGTLDTTFGTGGKVTTSVGSVNDIIFALGIQNDGKIVVAGQTDVGATTYFALARYNTNGTLDTTFDTDGIVTTKNGDYNSARALAIQQDGKIVIAGYSSISGSNDFTVIRYNSNGSLDSTFGIANSGIALADFGDDDYADALAIQDDGKIVVAGSSGGNFAVVRFNTDGSLDSTFGAGGGVTTPVGSYSEKAYAVGIQSNDKIVAAGFVEPDGAIAEFALVRYNADGTLDTTFDTDGIVTTEIVNASAMVMRIQLDGKIVAAGRTSVGGFYDFALVRYNTNGSLDTTFGANGIVTTPIGGYTEYASALSIQTDGKIIAAGNSLSGPSNVDFAVVRYEP